VTRFAAAPTERVAAPRIVSSLYPQLPRGSTRGFRVALVAGVAVVAALAALRLVPIALVGAAVVVPVLTVVYCYAVDVYERQPLVGVALTLGWGAASGAGAGLLARALAPTGAALVDRASAAHVVVGGLLLPLLGVALMLAGPLVLLPYRRYNDVLDGAAFGSVSAAAFAGSQVLVYGVHMFDRGLRPAGEPFPWIVRILAIAVAQPVLAMGAIGFAAAALWLRFRAPARDRGALGVLGHPLVAVGIAAALVVGGAVVEPLTAGGTWLAWLVVLDAVALVLLRRAIHIGLVEEAGEAATGPPLVCANCGERTAAGAFCSSCGVALRALPKGGEQGASSGRLSRAAAAAAALAFAAMLGTAAAVAAIGAPPAREALCRPYAPCGRPPVATPLVNGRIWRSSALGFGVEYGAGLWRVDGETPEGVTLTTSNPDGTLRLRGGRSPARDLLEDELASLRSAYLGFAPDAAPADELLGTNVGLRPGPGGAYLGAHTAPSGIAAQDTIAVMAAGEGGLSVVATVSTSAVSSDARAYVYRQADQVLKTVEWPG
jgi:hypothetical protein